MINYTINKTIKEKIESKFIEKEVGGYMEIKTYQNDSLINANYDEKKLLHFCMELIRSNDTLRFILKGPDVFTTFFFINKDSCYIGVKALDGLVGSFDKLNNISIDPFKEFKKIEVTFVSKPIIAKGELVEGVLEFTTGDYIDFRDDKLLKRNSKMRIYFKIKIPNSEEN